MGWEILKLIGWLKKLFPHNDAQQPGMITRTCRNCGKTFTLPENVQYWPDLCQECRETDPEQTIKRKCRGCGNDFTFPSAVKRWPKYCQDCQAKRKKKN